ASGMKCGIAPGKKHRIGLVSRSFIGKRRKRQDLRAQAAPAAEQVRIGKGECFIRGNSDALSERWESRRLASTRDQWRPGQRSEAVEINVRGDEICRAI